MLRLVITVTYFVGTGQGTRRFGFCVELGKLKLRTNSQKEVPRLRRGASRSLTFTAVVHRRSSRPRAYRHTEGSFLIDEQSPVTRGGSAIFRSRFHPLQMDNLSGERVAVFGIFPRRCYRGCAATLPAALSCCENACGGVQPLPSTVPQSPVSSKN
jgi:hypothetical protein